MGKKNKLTKPCIKAVALCKRGANDMVTLYKSADDGQGYIAELFTKAADNFNEKGIVYSVAYPVLKVDSQGDFADKDTVSEMAYSFAKNNMALNINHKGKSLEKSEAFVAESFILHKEALDPRFVALAKDYNGNPVDLDGAWGMVIKLETEELRKGYRDGDWNGVSIEGTAVRVPVIEKTDDTPDEATGKTVIEKTVDYIGQVLKSIFTGESQMEKNNPTTPAQAPVEKSIADQISEALAKSVPTLIETLKTSVAEEVKKAMDAGKTPEQLKAEQITALEKQLSDLKKASNQTPEVPAAGTPTTVEKVKSWGSITLG